MLIEAAYNMHNGEVTDLSAIREESNTVIYRSTDVRTLTDEQRGGFGQDIIDQRDTKGVRGSLQYALEPPHVQGRPRVVAERQLPRPHLRRRSTVTSLQPAWRLDRGPTRRPGSFSGRDFNVTNSSDFGGLINTINGLPNRAQFYAQFDANGDGVITSAEMGLAPLAFNSTAGTRTARSTTTARFRAQRGRS